MDHNLIYAKTASGESAIQQRTRIIQRNVRMVLILVDGRSSVADLANKIGNLQLTENALAELEKGGFIELKNEPDPQWSETSGEIQAAPPEPSSQESPFDFTRAVSFPGDLGIPPRASAAAPHSPAAAPHSSAVEAVEPLESGFAFPSALASPGLPPTPAIEPAEPKPPVDARREPWSRPIPEPEPAPEEKPPTPPASPLGKMKSLWTDDEGIKPVRRTNWMKRAGYAAAGLFVLGIAALAFFSFNTSRPELEAEFSKATGRPVSIEDLRTGFYPNPGLDLSNVRFGQGQNAILVRNIHLLPNVMTLFSERPQIRKVIVSGMEIRLERIAEISSIFAALAHSEDSPEIRRLYLEDVDVSFSGIVIKGGQADIQRDARGAMQTLSIKSADGKLSLAIESTAAGTHLTVEASAWDFGGNSKFVADSLRFTGLLSYQSTLSISDLDIRALEGRIQGNVVLQGGEKPRVAGIVTVEQINAARLGNAWGIGSPLSGILAGNLRFTSNSDSWATLLPAMVGEGSFNLQRGYINGFDLAEAVRRAPGSFIQGGSTIFEQMSGQMRLGKERTQFLDLNIASGLMRSTGSIDIARGERLSGKLELHVKGSANQMQQIGIKVGGSINAPTAQIVEQ